MRRTLLVVGGALLLVAPATATVKDGVQKWVAGDFKGAVTEWLPYAARGDVDALFNMGQAYKLGRGVAKNEAVAQDYYRKAAVKGHGPAQERLGLVLYSNPATRAEALRWLEQAARADQPRAQYVLAVATFNGEGVPKNWPLAYAYMLRASNRGIAQATAALTTMNANMSPADRQRGEQIAASFVVGTGPALLAAREPRRIPNPVAKPAASPAAAVTAAPLKARAAEPSTAAAPVQPASLPPAAGAAVADKLKSPVQAAASATADSSKPVGQAAAGATAGKLQPAGQPATSATIDGARPPAQPPAPAVLEPPSGWRVQVGAYNQRELANEAWVALKTDKAALLGGVTPIFAHAGGVVRLQLGPFPTRDAARTLCAKLSANGRSCFVVGG